MELERVKALAYNALVLLMEELYDTYEDKEELYEKVLEDLGATPEELVELGLEEFLQFIKVLDEEKQPVTEGSI